MTQEELVLKDLCAKFSYGVFLKIGEYSDYTLQGIVHSNVDKPLLVRRGNDSDFYCSIETVRPFLRSMSSMTEEEKMIQRSKMRYEGYFVNHAYYHTLEEFEYLDSIHVDYRGMIETNLAVEAPEGMYK